MNFFTGFFELFFPNNCLICKNDLLKHEKCLCIYCKAELPRTGFENVDNNIVEQTLWGRVNLNKGCSILYYRKGEAMQAILREIKYKGNKELAVEMGKLMGMALKNSSFIDNIDVIVPVPLHEKKLKKRGYNQSQLLAEGLAMICQLPIDNKLIYRSVNSSTQTKKGRFERHQNTEGVFAAVNSNALKGKSILLIDDVLTTGSTIEACANMMTNAKISVATLAYAV